MARPGIIGTVWLVSPLVSQRVFGCSFSDGPRGHSGVRWHIISNAESAVLAREVGNLGGLGAKWVARFLPAVEFENQIELNCEPGVAIRLVVELIGALGRAIPEFHSQPESGKLSLLVGGGIGGLNPTIVHVRVEPWGAKSRLVVRAISKEGLVKQRTAEGVAERIKSILAPYAA